MPRLTLGIRLMSPSRSRADKMLCTLARRSHLKLLSDPSNRRRLIVSFEVMTDELIDPFAVRLRASPVLH